MIASSGLPLPPGDTRLASAVDRAHEAAAPVPVRVRFEHHAEGRLGIGESRPRVSWQFAHAPADFVQLRAELHLTLERHGEPALVEHHLVEGPDQVLVAWPGPDLGSRTTATCRVRVESDAGWGPWSASSTVETGLLDPSDWAASFVGSAWPEGEDDLRRPARVRGGFTAASDVVRARLYLTGHGIVEAELNGRRVGDEELTPGWTSYTHRLRYATFDVLDHLVAGENVVGVWLGDGWWRGRIGFEGGIANVYGDDLSALVQLELGHADGSTTVVASDGSWQAALGPILSSSLYDGEVFDARLHDPGWSTVDGDAADWSPVATRPADPRILRAPSGPPVRVVDELRPVSITPRGEGRFVIDFGQNHSGRLRVTGTGTRGDVVSLRHAEIVEDGELYTRTLRLAAAHDRLILAGGAFTWEPRFTIHGYRYAEVSGWTGELTPDMVVSRVMHSDMERRGWFSSSHPGVDRLHENIVWSLRSNFVDIPADCPQRDERLGWTGDIQVFTPTASFLYDVTGLLASWLEDLAAEQRDRGTVPFYVPYLPLGSWQHAPVDPVAIWGDAAVLTPDAIHRRTGDTAVLRRQYDSAVAWIEQVDERATDEGICSGTMQLGDWLDPAAPADQPELATTSPELVATAYFAHSAGRLAAVAEVLGEHADAARFSQMAARVRAAFARHYLSPEGVAADETQTAYALAEVFELWPDEASAIAGGARLAALVREARGRIATGFAGTPVVTEALTRRGHVAEAYGLLLGEDCPSWLYMVAMGATTIWERWDSMLPDGTVNPGDMTSFNHYALGSVGDWLHRTVAGIAPGDDGYRSIHFEPAPGGGLTHAEASHLTPYGAASIRWDLAGELLSVRVAVPVGSRATVKLPGWDAPRPVGHGEHAFESRIAATAVAGG